MIAVDTNILLRYLLNDEPLQSPLAANIIMKHDQVLLTDVVLAETLWILKGAKYQFSKEQLAAILLSLVEDASFVFENKMVVWQSINDFIASGADFADALIMNKAKAIAVALRDPLTAAYSFDRKAKSKLGFKNP